ncbi:MAG: flagellar hook-basal body complex protein FliE [Chromatiales bacterium]
MNNIDMNSVLSQMRAMAACARSAETAPVQGTQPGGGGFATILKSALDHVNRTQMGASELATAFETGASDADIAEVMLAMQKASLSFQAVTQVHNKLLAAYQEIMNMQI